MRRAARIARYLKPYWHLAACAATITLVFPLIGLLAPWPQKLLIDNVLSNQPLSRILASFLRPIADNRPALFVFAVALKLALSLVVNGLSVVDRNVTTKLELGMVHDFRSDLFHRALRLSLPFSDRSRSGAVTYAINDGARAGVALVMAARPLAQSLVTLVGMFWISLQLDPPLALLSLAVVPLLSYSVRDYTRHVPTRLREVKAMEIESLSMIQEAMLMLRVIAGFGREDFEHRRYRDHGRRAVDARVGLTRRQTLFSLAVHTTTALGTGAVLGFGAYHVIQGKLTIGAWLVVMYYVAAVYMPLETIGSTVASLQDEVTDLQLALELLDGEPQIEDTPGAMNIGRARGHIAFDEVSFSYEGRVATLNGISFEAPPGQLTAIVGPTGAGKTTLVSLIPRFYDPVRGHIRLDGIDIRALTLKSLRQQISIVFQEPLLFSGRIADNIRYGRLDAREDAIVEAAKAAGVHNFICGLPDGYDTRVGERGVTLSGGERQRIALARAFLKDAPILILDEPTSSVDSKTEEVILEALERLMVGRTTILVAHRLSTLRNADLVIVLDRGHLVEQGRHADLLRSGGLFKQLHDIQMGQAQLSFPPT